MSHHDPARRPTAAAERYERLLGVVSYARPDGGELIRFGLDAIAPADLPPDVGTDWAFQRVMVALRTSRPQEAEQWARHLIPARLDHQGLRFALARALEEQGRWAEAREVLQAFTHPASDARYQQGSARYHYLWADRREARRLYAVVLDRIRSVGDVDSQRLAGHELPDYAYVFLDWAAMCLLDGDPATVSRQLDHDAATLRDGSFGRVDAANPSRFVDGATFRFLRGVLAQAAGDMGVRLPRSRIPGILEFGDFAAVQNSALRERSADSARQVLLRFRPLNRTDRVLVTAALAALGGRTHDGGMERSNLARLRLRSPNLLEPHLALQFRMLAAQERWLDPYRAHRSAHRPPPPSLPPPATVTLPDAPPTATTEVPASLDHALRALARSHADASAISTIRQHAATMPFPIWEELTDAMTQRGAHALVHDFSAARLADAHPLELPIVAGPRVRCAAGARRPRRGTVRDRCRRGAAGPPVRAPAAARRRVHGSGESRVARVRLPRSRHRTGWVGGTRACCGG